MDDEMRDRIRFIGGFVLFCLAIRWLCRHPWAIAGIVVFFIVNDMWTDHVKATIAPPHETIEVLRDGPEIDFNKIVQPQRLRTWQPDNNNTPYSTTGAIIMSGDYKSHATITLTLVSTYERKYYPRFAICSLRGTLYYAPPYWDNRFVQWGTKPTLEPASFVASINPYYRRDYYLLGERRVLVVLVAVDKAGKVDTNTYMQAATRGMFSDATKVYPRYDTQDYAPASPSEVITDRDVIEWCKVGESIDTLAASVRVAMDARTGSVAGAAHLEMITVTPYAQQLGIGGIALR